MYKILFFILCYIGYLTCIFANDPYCEIRDDSFNYLHNFTQLMENKEDISITGFNETIRIQLCKPLNKECNGMTGYHICLQKNGKEFGIGRGRPQIIKTSGNLHFNFTGEDCTKDVKYSVYIFMKCDYKADDKLPKIILDNDQCQIYITWLTRIACKEEHDITHCNTTDGKDHYDLSPLKKFSENYKIFMNNTNSQIILNVCHSVINEFDAQCTLMAGACIRKKNEKGISYHNIGDVKQSGEDIRPFVENGVLKIVYEQGESCKNKNVSLPHIITTINFICDIEAKNTLPQYISGAEQCNYTLEWKTAAACSIEMLRNYSKKTEGDCIVTDPVTNYTYNMKSLKNQDFFVTGPSKNDYKLTICEAKNENNCKFGTGICLINNKTSMGTANDHLMWTEGGPYLNYTDGDICDSHGTRRYTMIAFICAVEGSLDVPTIMEEDPCKLIIHWSSNLVCKNKMECGTDNNLFSLSRLTSTKNYVIKSNKTEFHVNVCRSLVPQSDITCAHGSAACKVTLNEQGKLVNETSLGFPRKKPFLNKEGQLVLEYTGGSSCLENSKTSISSNFLFKCNNKEELPTLKGYENCTYNFEWKTKYACGTVHGEWLPTCGIRSRIQHQFDLSVLSKMQPVLVSRNNKTYNISICGVNKQCNGTICEGKNSYGSNMNVEIDYSQNIIKIEYSNGSKCNNGYYSSVIRFMCDKSVGIGTPNFLWDTPCNIGLAWYTNLTCDPLLVDSNVDGNVVVETADKIKENEKTSSGVNAGVITALVFVVIVVILVLIYFRKYKKKDCFKWCSNVFSSNREGGRVKYCRVETSEEARLLLNTTDPTECQIDSDDDLLDA